MTTLETIYRRQPFALRDKTNESKQLLFDTSNFDANSNNTLIVPNSNGTIALTNDNGDPNIGFFVGRDTNQSIANATFTNVQFNKKSGNEGTWNDPHNLFSIFTPASWSNVPYTGYYNLAVDIQTNGNGGIRYVDFNIDSTTVAIENKLDVPGQSRIRLSVKHILLQDTSTVAVRFWQNSGSAISIERANFGVWFIGPS